jgi:hypothetical protein
MSRDAIKARTKTDIHYFKPKLIIHGKLSTMKLCDGVATPKAFITADNSSAIIVASSLQVVGVT